MKEIKKAYFRLFITKNKSFSSLPFDEERKSKWINQIETFTGKKVDGKLESFLICSNHFEPEEREMRGKLHVIKKGAFPTIFPIER